MKLKKNVIKLFICLSMVGLYSCANPSSSEEGYFTCEIKDIKQYNDNQQSIYHNKKVSIDNVTITSKYGNVITLLDYELEGESNYYDVVSIEVFFENEIDYEVKDMVNIKGVVSSNNGRIIILGQTIEYAINEELSSSKGKIINYNIYGRSGYEEMDNKTNSSLYFKSIFELVSKPNFDNNDYDFQVVFPGEENKQPFLIDVLIPNSINNSEKEALIDVMEQLSIGSYYRFRAMLYYDDKDCLLLPPQVYNLSYFEGIDCEVYQDYENVKSSINQHFDLIVPDFESETAYSFYLDTNSYFNSKGIIMINIYSSDLENDYLLFNKNCIKFGWSVSYYNEIKFKCNLFDSSSNLIGCLILKKFNNHLRLLISDKNFN